MIREMLMPFLVSFFWFSRQILERVSRKEKLWIYKCTFNLELNFRFLFNIQFMLVFICVTQEGFVSNQPHTHRLVALYILHMSSIFILGVMLEGLYACVHVCVYTYSDNVFG